LSWQADFKPEIVFCVLRQYLISVLMTLCVLYFCHQTKNGKHCQLSHKYVKKLVLFINYKNVLMVSWDAEESQE